jgi:hypothetical protein
MSTFIDEFITYYRTTDDYQLDKDPTMTDGEFPRRMLASFRDYILLSQARPDLAKPIPGLDAALASVQSTLATPEGA